jgi:5-methyltetrahydrofolate--homocysteine methyltransferase
MQAFPTSLGYDETPEIMAGNIREFLENSYVNIIGGCCGTTPNHIHEFAKMAASAKPHQVNNKDGYTRLSGLEPVTLTPEANFMNIGERCNVSGSRQFARLIRDKKYEEALALHAIRQKMVHRLSMSISTMPCWMPKRKWSFSEPDDG